VFTAYGSAGLPARFVSPDETANYYFARTFAQHGTLRVAEALDAVASPIVAPRSMGISEGFLVPVSFVGVPLIYGLVAKAVGLWILCFITPLIALIGGIFFYFLIRRLFDRSIGLIASLLLLLHPAYWYFTARSMMHNVPFASLVIIAAYFFVRMVTNGRFWSYGLFGLSIGMALIFRTIEGVWLIPLFGILTIVARKRIQWRLILISLVCVALFVIPMLITNRQLFGSLFAFGYSPTAVASDSITSLVRGIGSKIGQALFPFGLSIGGSWHNWSDYFIRMFPWYGIPAVMGWLWFVVDWFNKWRNKYPKTSNQNYQHIYFLATTLVGIWLILYYGSWRIQEFENPNQLILGSSYIRYWLPVYIFSIPYVVLGGREIINRLSKRLHQAGATIIVLVFVLITMKLVLLDPLYGLAKVRDDIREYDQINLQIQEATPTSAVIIAGKADKVVFPERKVITQDPSTEPSIAPAVRRIMQETTVYYYCSFTESWCLIARTSGSMVRGSFRYDFAKELTHGNMLFRLSAD
jgi:hypothetical protein